MKTNMRLTTVVAAALLVVLAGSGIAGAATITLSIVIDDNTLEIGESTPYTVYGAVTDNTVVDNYDVVFDGGIASFMVDEVFASSGTGAIRHMQGSGPPSTTGSNALPLNPPFTAANAGKIQNAAWADAAQGTGGVNNIYGGQSTAGGYAYYSTDPAMFARLRYGNVEAVTAVIPPAIPEIVNPNPAPLFTGTFIAVANGTVDITVSEEPQNCLVWSVGIDGETTISKVAEIVVSATGQVIVGTVTTSPTILIDTASVGEGDWTQEPGWNNDVHEVAIASTITDGPADVVWTLTNPNTATAHALGATGDDFTLTMLEINGLFGAEVPVAGGLPVEYNWILQASVDGGASTDSITVFVPEPATMGLLAFGVIGLLKRRRRA